MQLQLQHFIIDVYQASSLNNLSIQELCSSLVATETKESYFMINRLLYFIMTLLVSIATKGTFSKIKIIMTSLRRKMETDVSKK